MWGSEPLTQATLNGETMSREKQVCERMALLRAERPNEDNWIGYVFAEHEPGECIDCDALRLLDDETA
jgi:hypothetical protein